MVGIYKIINPSGKVYIGQSINLEKRLRCYQQGASTSQRKIYRSIKKYGWDSHAWEILEECEESQLNERERYYQEFYKSVEYGLNCKYTETYDKTGKLSEETKRLIGDRHRGKITSEEHKQKLSKFFKGKPGKKLSEEVKMKMRKPKPPRSKEHCKKLSECRKGKALTEEHKKKQSEALKGIVRSEETKKKLSEKAKQRMKKTCPHCDKVGDPGLMTLWHFDNCKNKI